MKIWFQNRRARDRRERKDLLYRDSTSLGASSTTRRPVDGDAMHEEEEDIEVS